MSDPDRAEFKRRRDAGLKKRHALRLKRARGCINPTPKETKS